LLRLIVGDFIYYKPAIGSGKGFGLKIYYGYYYIIGIVDPLYSIALAARLFLLTT